MSGHRQVQDTGLESVLGGLVTIHPAPSEALLALEQLRLSVMTMQDFKTRGDADLGRPGLRRAILEDVASAGHGASYHRLSYRSATRVEPLRSLVDQLRTAMAELVGFELRKGMAGTAYYPAGGHLGWHSNHNRPGRRVYCTWAAAEASCFFRTYDSDADQIDTYYEPQGWSIRSFRIPRSPDRVWHCIGAGSARVSLGFKSPD